MSTSGPDRTLAALRRDRRLLQAEQTTIRRWRRLLRARIDLAVAVLAEPEPLGQHVAGLVPSATEHALPMHDDLRAAVAGAPSAVNRLDALWELDQRIAHYAEAVDTALERATSALVAGLAEEPSACLDVLGAAAPPAAADGADCTADASGGER